MTMSAEIAAKLRTPFPKEMVGKLPRVTCGACSKDKVQKHCDRHQRAQCNTCGNYISTAHMHIDFVGHAAVTDRILSVDPEWSWEPMGLTSEGLPALDKNGGLWIRLTIAGVSRIGYGDAMGSGSPDSIKVAIGDALKNAAMRFGVALDLWSKQELEQADSASEPAPQQRSAPTAEKTTAAPGNGRATNPSSKLTDADAAKAKIRKAASESGWDLGKVAARFEDIHGVTLKESTNAALIEGFRESLFALPENELAAAK